MSRRILVILEKVFFLIGLFSFVLSILLIAIFKFEAEIEMVIFFTGIITSLLFISLSNKVVLFDRDFSRKNTLYFDSKIQSKQFRESVTPGNSNLNIGSHNLRKSSSVKNFRSK